MRNSITSAILLSFLLIFGVRPSAAQTRAPSTYNAYTGTDVKAVPPPPALGPANSVIADPTFGSRILRVTDANTKGGESFISTDSGFSRAWNADSTAIKLTGPFGDGYWMEFNPSTFQAGTGSGEPAPHPVSFGATWEWSAVQPNIIYYLSGSTIKTYNTTSGASTTLASTPTGDPVAYTAAVVGLDNWVCVAVGAGPQDTYTKIFCVSPSNPSIYKFIDVVNKTINGAAQSSPNWPTAAAGGTIGIHDISGGTGPNWLEVTFHQQSWGANGGAVFDLSSNTWSLVTNADPYWSGHVSMGNGRYENSSGSIDGHDSRGIVLRDPDNLMNSSQYLFVMQPFAPWNSFCDADHSSWLNSLTNPNAPILVSRYSASAACQFAWSDEIVAAAVDGSNTVWRFAHNFNGGSLCYYAQAFAQISNDGNWALFSSYWGGTLGPDISFGCATRIDTFIVDLKGAPVPPTANSVSPDSGAGASQVFTFQYSSVYGYGYLSQVQALLNTPLSGTGACWVNYIAASNSLYLANDAGTGSVGPLTPGSAGTLTNSQCTLNGPGSTITGAGNTLTMVLSLNFSASFTGLKTYYGTAIDNGNFNSAWHTLGTWYTGIPPAPAANFVNTDIATQGTWKGVYGADGEAIYGDSANYPAYAQVAFSGNSSYVWTSSSSDVRDLQKAAALDRIASVWYTTSNMRIDVNLMDGKAHQVALYFLDWDNAGRAERIDLLNATSSAVLDTRTISGFSNGEYLVWNVKGHVTFKVTLTAGANAVVSGLFLGSLNNTAKFVATDTMTQGTWKGQYGADGEAIYSDSANYPAYAQVTFSGNSSYVWASSSNDVRDLQKAAALDRIASVWYTTSNMRIDVNLMDGKAHQVGLYFLDWDNVGRAQRIDVLDATSSAVLDTRTISGFSSGEYLVWNLAGHVTFKITLTSGANAVVSGLFFGPAEATAAFVATDTMTQGTWKSIYGADGEAIYSDSANYPPYAQVAFTGNSSYVWTSSSSDIRDLQKAAALDRVASVWYTTSNMRIDVNLTDGKAHQVALYFLDWDHAGRAERIDVLDATSSAVLETRTISSFSNGEYLVWNLTGHVTFKITLTAGANAVVSGLFFGPPAGTAAFVATDTMTQGTWKGVYGADGESIYNDSTNYPPYAQVAFTGNSSYVWVASSTTDVRDLQKAAALDRIASVWYTSSNMRIDVNLTDGKAHQLALYFLDWDHISRAERIDVLDATSSAALDTRTISGFSNGEYLVWNLTGHVTFKITLTAGANAVVSGLFFDSR